MNARIDRAIGRSKMPSGHATRECPGRWVRLGEGKVRGRCKPPLSSWEVRRAPWRRGMAGSSPEKGETTYVHSVRAGVLSIDEEQEGAEIKS